MAPQSLIEQIGGESVIRILVDKFYDYMDQLPEVEVIRKLHQEDLTEAREKLFEFLVGWSGGPPLYISKYGHPRLRMRHMPFPIGEKERDQWMLCMRKALEDSEIDPSVKARLDGQFLHIADFMKNIDG
ncbi:group II truncated hemoglobin [candidate division WWE3 bacterium]|uniref:Group II truncated hemoglobin n=1 Tax=candidate division WWE3 bacterium TaxID=2053526 RepID=A0A955LHR6_UNCKA|nr:group II truncated hemoglobin [candidate division WWE3 bacterium]